MRRRAGTCAPPFSFVLLFRNIVSIQRPFQWVCINIFPNVLILRFRSNHMIVKRRLKQLLFRIPKLPARARCTAFEPSDHRGNVSIRSFLQRYQKMNMIRHNNHVIDLRLRIFCFKLLYQFPDTLSVHRQSTRDILRLISWSNRPEQRSAFVCTDCNKIRARRGIIKRF